MTTLTRANREWASRAPDERFASLAAIHENATIAAQDAVIVEDVPMREIRAVASGDDVKMTRGGGLAALTNWSFGRLCNEAKIDETSAPAGYLSKLPAGLAADCINIGLDSIAAGPDRDRKVSLLLDRSAGVSLRAMNSPRYGRIWDADITKRLLRMEAEGPWQPAPAAFDGSRGLYRGDRNMFIFMVDSDRRIFETLPGGGLSRGFFCWNSEVGDKSFGILSFLYEYCCGNHRVWGATELSEIKVRHVGDADDRAAAKWGVALKRYAEDSATEDEAKILAARNYEVGATKDEILDVLFSMREPALTKGLIKEALALADRREDWYGNPRSAWAMGGAVTEIARDMPNADTRLATDRAGRRILDLAF